MSWRRNPRRSDELRRRRAMSTVTGRGDLQGDGRKDGLVIDAASVLGLNKEQATGWARPRGACWN